MQAAKAYDVGKSQVPEGSPHKRIMSAAVSWLVEQCEDMDRAAAARLIHRFKDRAVHSGNVDDKPRSGRKRMVTAAQASKGKEIIKAGYQVSGDRTLPFRSVRHAVESCAELRSIMQDAGIKSTRTLQRALQREYPELQSRILRTLKALTDDQKQARVQCAGELRELLQKDPNIKKRLVFLDSKMYVIAAAGNGRYFIDTSDPIVTVQADQPLSHKQQKINAYIAAGWYGPYGFYPVTGSSWLPEGHKQYKVS